MKKKLKNSFVVAYDTICDGNQCHMDGEGKPLLYPSKHNALQEIFDSALSNLENKEPIDLKECGITKKLLAKMKAVEKRDNPEEMENFLIENPEMNDYGEWVEVASEFIMNRKVIFTGSGLKITGTKL